MICVLCKKEIKGFSNHAEPLAKGFCCHECNVKVIRERIKQLKKIEEVKEGETIKRINKKSK